MVSKTVAAITELGSLCLFTSQLVRVLCGSRPDIKEITRQMYNVGVRSVPVIASMGIFVGAILAMQVHLQLKDFGAEGFLGGVSAAVTIRNVGPVLIAFLLSGKVGAFTAAELATMQVTDQISAIRVLGTDPIQYIIVPRFIAVVLSSFLLLVIGLSIATIGGMLMGEAQLGVNAIQYVGNIPRLVDLWGIGVGVVKSFVFGCLIATVCCYQGYRATGGSEGVGKSVKSSSVITLVSIIVMDFMISSVATLLQGWVEGG